MLIIMIMGRQKLDMILEIFITKKSLKNWLLKNILTRNLEPRQSAVQRPLVYFCPLVPLHSYKRTNHMNWLKRKNFQKHPDLNLCLYQKLDKWKKHIEFCRKNWGKNIRILDLHRLKYSIIAWINSSISLKL